MPESTDIGPNISAGAAQQASADGLSNEHGLEWSSGTTRIAYEDIEHSADGAGLDGRAGNFLVTVGNVGSGKSTLQNFMIYRLWSDERIGFDSKSIDGSSNAIAILDAWVQNLASGYLPKRTKRGLLQEFNIRISQRRNPILEFNFLEIAGEDIRSIVPNGNPEPARLHDVLERYLRLPDCNRRFVFVSDASRNRPGARRDARMYEEDILFNHLIRYLLSEHGIGLRRLSILFVAAKWDEVKTEYSSERQYFKSNFPRTRATVKESGGRIDASYMPFSIGEVQEELENGERVAKVRSFETKYVDALVNWVYSSFSGRSLRGFPKVKLTLWDRIKHLFANLLS